MAGWYRDELGVMGALQGAVTGTSVQGNHFERWLYSTNGIHTETHTQIHGTHTYPHTHKSCVTRWFYSTNNGIHTVDKKW